MRVNYHPASRAGNEEVAMFTFLNSLRRSSRPARARTSSDLGKRPQRPEIEALEARLNPGPIAGIDLVPQVAPPVGPPPPPVRVLHVRGDNANNMYTLDHSGQTTLLNIYGLNYFGQPTLRESFQFSDYAYDSVEIDTGSGSDVINIEATLAGKPVTILEQGSYYGNMLVNLAAGSHNLSNIQGDVTVDADYGTDSISLYDQNSVSPFISVPTGNRTYTITATTVTWGNHATLHYNDYQIGNQVFVENNVVLYGSYGSVYNVESTSGTPYFRTSYTINESSSGIDTVNFAPGSHNLDSIQGYVTVNGNGNGQINFHDEYAWDSYKASYSEFTDGGYRFAPISYKNQSQVDIWTNPSSYVDTSEAFFMWVYENGYRIH
jgi:hypothetical protein